MAQMIIPRADGSHCDCYSVASQSCPIGKTKVKFFIHDGTLSHFASGFRFGNLNDVKIRNMCRLGHHHTMTDQRGCGCARLTALSLAKARPKCWTLSMRRRS